MKLRTKIDRVAFYSLQYIIYLLLCVAAGMILILCIDSSGMMAYRLIAAVFLPVVTVTIAAVEHEEARRRE